MCFLLLLENVKHYQSPEKRTFWCPRRRRIRHALREFGRHEKKRFETALRWFRKLERTNQPANQSTDNYCDWKEPKKHRNSQNGSKSTNHKSQTMTFWTRWSKLSFPKRSTDWRLTFFLTRGSKCTNHRKTVLIACFLRGHLNLLFSLFYVHFLFFILWLVDFVRSSG